MPSPADDHARLVALARDVRALLDVQYQVLRRKNYGLLDQAKAMEKDLRKRCDAIINPTLFGDD